MDFSRRISQEEKEQYIKLRKSWRAKAYVNVDVFYEGRSLAGVTADIGEGGLKFELGETIPINTIVMIKIPVVTPQKIRGKILETWTLRAGTVVHRCQFLNISKSLKNELLGYVFNRLR